MLNQDLEEVTCRQLRLLLEKEVEMDLKEYKGFLDQQMLRILGQMERPSQIFDYLYLVCVLSQYFTTNENSWTNKLCVYSDIPPLHHSLALT